MLRANYSRNITAAKNAKKKWWERKEGSLKEKKKKKAGNGKPVICVTLGLRAVLTERGKVEAPKVCGQPKSQTLRNTQTLDPKTLQETKRCMSNVQIKVEK